MKFLPRRFFLRMTIVNILLGIAALVTTVLVGRHFLKDFYHEQLGHYGRIHLEGLKVAIEDLRLSPEKWCRQLQKNGDFSSRFTLVEENGRVLCDTQEDFKVMDNHSDRPEIREALLGGHGMEIRYGRTLRKNMLYNALALQWKNEKGKRVRGILRQGLSMDSLDMAFHHLDASLKIIIVPVIILLSLIYVWRGFFLSRPLENLLEKVNTFEKEGQGEKVDRPAPDPADTGANEWEVLDRALGKAYIDIKKQKKVLGQERIKFSILLNSLSEAILAVDSNSRTLFFNPAFSRTFLSDSLSSRASQLELWEIFRHRDILNAFQATLQGREQVQLNDLKLGASDGTSQYYHLVVSPLMEKEKKEKGVKGSETLLGAVAVFYNITPIKLADQMRVDFVANISHEVRTPLASIQGSLDLLKIKQDEWGPGALNFLEKISRNTQRLLNLFQDLLHLSLLESERDLNPEWTDLTPFAQQVLQNMKTAYGDDKMELHLTDTKERALVDQNLLEQILNNLLENTFKYVPDFAQKMGKKGKVQVSFTPHEKGVLLTVTDNGPGISREHRQRIFERFYRVESSRSPNGAGGSETGPFGTGLGLSIVKHAAIRHHGQVWVEEAKGGGSVFKVYLPEIFLPEDGLS